MAETQAAQNPRPSGSARPRLVLGLGLLILGLGDLLFINIVLLPKVLAGQAVVSPGQAVGTASSPGSPPVQNEPESAAPVPAEEQAVAPAIAPAPSPSEAPANVVIPSSAAPTPAPAEAPKPAPTPVAVRVEAPKAKPAPTPVAARVETPPVVPAGEQPAPAAAPSAEPTETAFSPLLFAPNSAWLSPQAEKSLAKLAALLKRDSTLRVRIHGHTDDFGPERFNEVLSLKRAEQVRARLQDQGIGEERVDIKGFGSQQPADTARTMKARARNRRVEITLY